MPVLFWSVADAKPFITDAKGQCLELFIDPISPVPSNLEPFHEGKIESSCCILGFELYNRA